MSNKDIKFTSSTNQGQARYGAQSTTTYPRSESQSLDRTRSSEMIKQSTYVPELK